MTQKRRWQVAQADPAAVAAIATKHNVSKLIATVMVNRGLDPTSAGKYLAPNLSSISDPETMRDMKKAADRLSDAIIRKEKSTIVLDFDADGVGAGAVLLRFGKMIGYEFQAYVPDRITEGYGLKEDAVRQIKQSGADLIVTVDLGITASKEAKLCKDLGIDLIITDHHQPELEKPEEMANPKAQPREKIPEAIAVVNPHQTKCNFPFKSLAGVGVAFSLVVATRKALREKGFFAGKPEPRIADLLPLVALSTIADIVELKEENRIFVSYGLKNMYNLVGLKALGKVAGLDISVPPTAGKVAFNLAPRINASGRMDSARFALDLLTTEDESLAAELAAKLNTLNEERQSEEQKVIETAIKMIESDPSLLKRKTIVLAGDFHPGICGIAASKILELYYRPIIIISDRQDGTGKGSCRSIAGFDIRGALDLCSDLLIGYGGHPMAAGLSLDMKNLQAFRDRFEKAASPLTEEDLLPITKIDAELCDEDMTVSTIRQLGALEPFGAGNAGPVFCVRSAEIISRTDIKEKHLKLEAKVGQRKFNAIGWGMIDRSTSPLMNLAFSMEINEFRGAKTVQLVLKDMTAA